jgi:hypothetical protein
MMDVHKNVSLLEILKVKQLISTRIECWTTERGGGESVVTCWQIFNIQRMLVIDGKYNNEDGMSTKSM